MYDALVNLIRIHKLYNSPAKANEAQQRLNMLSLPNTEVNKDIHYNNH